MFRNMLVVDAIVSLRQAIRSWRCREERVALVPTMGNLHEGHLALVRAAQKVADRTVVSIFVNPMQFNNAQDLADYPKTLDEDRKKLQRFGGVDLIFCPATATVYPDSTNNHTIVYVPELSDILEGADRPGHFRGVATIVCKLFNLIRPDVAVFGEKDFQQLRIIRKMATDLAFDIDIISVPTVRHENGLAISSRNTLLSDRERRITAPKLYEVMKSIGERLTRGEYGADDNAENDLLVEGELRLREAGFEPDSLYIRDAVTLEPLTNRSVKAVVLMAATLGRVRLIDNLEVDLSPGRFDA